jgi:phenylacetate-CoA ligase
MLIPMMRRNLIEPIHNIKIVSPKLKYWKNVEKTQYLPEVTLREMQWYRLKNIIKYVYFNNSFYRKHFEKIGFHPEDLKTADDIMKLPILTKDEIRDNIQNMISKDYCIDTLLKFKTGGSTGKPLEIYITEECSELRNACARRHDRWTGWEVGEPVGAVWGNPELPKNSVSKLKNWLLNPCIYLDTMEINESSVIKFAEDWQKMKPTLLFGHSHSIYILAEYLKELSIYDIKPKGIITTSMMLLPAERKTIHNVFQVDIFDRYGCEEVSLIASECEKHEGMHINVEHLYVEFIKENGKYANSGENGKIIVTDLINKAMPFIRYQVEDYGAPTSRKCSCGRGLPLIEKVSGRLADFLVKKDGTKVAGISLIENTWTKIPGIKQMQIIQDSFDIFNIYLVPNPDCNAETKTSLINYFKRLFGAKIEVNIVMVKSIKPESSGKYRFTICKVQ